MRRTIQELEQTLFAILEIIADTHPERDQIAERMREYLFNRQPTRDNDLPGQTYLEDQLECEK